MDKRVTGPSLNPLYPSRSFPVIPVSETVLKAGYEYLIRLRRLSQQSDFHFFRAFFIACEPDPHFEETFLGKLFLSGSCFYGKPFFGKSFYGKPFYGKTVWGQLLFGEGIGNELIYFIFI